MAGELLAPAEELPVLRQLTGCRSQNKSRHSEGQCWRTMVRCCHGQVLMLILSGRSWQRSSCDRMKSATWLPHVVLRWARGTCLSDERQPAGAKLRMFSTNLWQPFIRMTKPGRS